MPSYLVQGLLGLLLGTGQTNWPIADWHVHSLGPGSAVGEKAKKQGQIGKNIGEPSEPSGGLGRGKGLRSPIPPFFSQCGA